jgi:hypothetical protein
MSERPSRVVYGLDELDCSDPRPLDFVESSTLDELAHAL